jgi:hypothetical protein
MAERNMNDAEQETREYLIPKSAVAPLQGGFNLVRNKLAEVIALPNQGDPAAANQWWRTQKPDDQLALHQILAGVSSPTQVSAMAILREEAKLVETTLIQQSIRAGDPCFLLGEDAAGANFKARMLPSADTMAATILMYLDAGLEPGIADFKFEVSLNEFTVLLATLDLYKRAFAQSLMEHEDFKPDMKVTDVQKSLEDGLQYPDPRWLVPFVAPIMPVRPQLDWNGIWQAIYSLANRGLVKISQDKTTIILTEPGELMATEVRRRMTMVRIASLGYTPDGRPGSQTFLFMRGESLVWYIDIGINSVVVAAIDLDKASELLKEVFKPQGMPQVAQPASRCSRRQPPPEPRRLPSREPSSAPRAGSPQLGSSSTSAGTATATRST